MSRERSDRPEPSPPPGGSPETEFYYGLEASTVAASETDGATRLTDLLHAWRHGDSDAHGQLVPRLHEELLRVARRTLRHNLATTSLRPSDLVHEACRRLMGSGVPWRDRVHFFGLAAPLLRQILVEHAHSVRQLQRDGSAAHLTLHEASGPEVDVLRLDRALGELEQHDRNQGLMIELRYFSGLEDEEIAEVLGVPGSAVGYELRFGRAWLKRRLRDDAD